MVVSRGRRVCWGIALLLAVLPALVFGQTTPELALLPGTGKWLMSLSLSADGARLLSVDGNGTATVWDVDRRQPVCRIESAHFVTKPAPVRVNGQLSEDGRVVLLHTGRLAAAFEADSGRPIGEPIKAPTAGIITAIALSSDGKYVATAINERQRDRRDLILPPKRLVPNVKYPGVGEITVWQLPAVSVAWRVPAAGEVVDEKKGEGTVAILAFSPDGRRLAVLTHRLRVLTLTPGRELPEGAERASQAGELHGYQLAWAPQGRNIIIRTGIRETEERTLEVFDAQTLERQGERFRLDYMPRTPAKKGIELDDEGNPKGSRQWNVLLAPRGGRMAAIISRDTKKDDRVATAMRLAIFDTRERRPVGGALLPDSAITASRFEDDFFDGFLVTFQIGMSADGQRVAVGDLEGNIRVFAADQLTGPAAGKAADTAKKRKKQQP